uniref:Uncharacterized protein n=1 Tax=Hordeum vulgare subsp. vulgare TaxID=112509 RepID=A0A8I6XL19_HORVV
MMKRMMYWPYGGRRRGGHDGQEDGHARHAPTSSTATAPPAPQSLRHDAPAAAPVGASAASSSSDVQQLQLRQQLHNGTAAADVQRREPQRLRHLLAS